MKKIIMLFVVLTLATVSAQADNRAQLEAYYTEVQSLSGRFIQETVDDRGELVERTEGAMYIQRPNRFRWEYEAPYEQDIVADGRDLWVHDADLFQVTVRPLEEVLGSGPALMLSGELEDLESQFEIGSDGDWVTLTPRDEGWEVTGVRLRFVDGVPETVVVKDGMGQENRLELSEVEKNPELSSELFDYQVPDDADLIGEPSE
ncbi:outer membrane lipoprotein chaperone LolA [Methylonatrum kenyense]|uniref:outer membrane lipoprotein chaperone LolA n=1 Tax=Methylonatrum kenyense TaxID=455253 RepID=UPI0020C10667|nr:outer membrane lipoprotein chaperone LolA [Methylonatrum kenyense]MCK8515720.1 outer membrane lipoprotein chaperone LolA [Methylonatrum kenyense]